jgi:predicted house-cleaning noncanonical NTP pyrophosphatase (MazG superfamily)
MKLIRDKVPDIAASKGETIRTRLAQPEERWRLLKAKLVEEALELQDAQPGTDTEFEEIADVVEVMRRLCDDLELSEPGKIQTTYDRKLAENGEVGFLVLLEGDEK